MAISDWKIEILTPQGALRQTYTNANPGGVVSRITYSLEPSGNCLEASFDAVPKLVNIQPRDLAKIYVDDMVTPKWYGYFRNHANPESSKVVTYTLEGAKKLIYDFFVDQFFYNTNVTLPSGLVSHSNIVSALQDELPVFVSPTIDNQASTTTGNKPPIIATDYSLGSIFDDITYSASDGEYAWGVYGTGQLFVKPDNSTTLDLSADPNKRIEYRTQGTDTVVSAIRYVFGIQNSHKFTTDYKRIVDDGRVNESFSDRPLTYTYSDSAAITDYTKFMKVQPVVLSDTWMKAYTTTEFANINGTQRIIAGSNVVGDWVTNTGSTNVGLFPGILTDGTGGYIRNGTAQWGTSLLKFWYQLDGYLGLLDLTGFVGLRMRYEVRASNLQASMSYWYEYDNYSIATQTPNAPRYDVAMHWWELTDGDIIDTTFFMPPRSLADFRVDPEDLNTDGNPFGSISDFELRFHINSLNDSIVQADSFRIYAIQPIFLNKAALDSIGTRLVKTPAEYPTTVKTQTVGPLAKNMTINRPSGGNITEQVRRVSYEVSKSRGLETTYELGTDEQRDNSVFERLFAADDAAALTAYRNSTGQV